MFYICNTNVAIDQYRYCLPGLLYNMLDWDDFDMHEDDEDYIESQKRKQKEEEQQKKLRY